MGWVLPFLTGIFMVIFTVVIIIVRVKTTQKRTKFDIRENAPYIIVGKRKAFCNGYGLGLVRNQYPRKNDCTLIEFYPVDGEQGMTKPLPELQAVVVRNEFINRYAVGEYSAYREVIELVDKFKTDLPRKMWDTPKGERLEDQGRKAFLLQAYGKHIKEGDDALLEMISENTRVGATKSFLARIREQNRQLQKAQPQPSNEESGASTDKK